MDQKLIDRILAAPPLRLSDLRPGDRVRGFEGWQCIHDNATRTVREDSEGLYVSCLEGHHYLDGNTDEDGVLLGMIRVKEVDDGRR